MTERTTTVDTLLSSRRFRPWEALPLCVAGIVYLFFPTYLPLATQIVVMVLFALSLDILLGYTGIVTLGHAAYFGVGAYTAGILAVSGWNEPISGLVIGMVIAALVGAITGAIIIRTSGLALLMLGMAVTLLFHEAANHMGSITGGADGLQGITIRPIMGLFAFDLFNRVGFIYALIILFLGWLFVRHLVNSPFGRSLVGIRENPTRMAAIGVPVQRRKLIAFTIGAALAGLAGALSAQTNQFVGLDTLSFELSGTVLVVLVMGGSGRLYGAFLGAPVYFFAQDRLAKDDPIFWLFWLGLILIGIVMFARGGIFGIIQTLINRISTAWDRGAYGARARDAQ